MKVEVRVIDADGESMVIVQTTARLSEKRIAKIFKIAERAMSDLVNEPFKLPHSS